MIAVTIGFSSTTHTVGESDGSVLLMVSLQNGTFDEDATVNVTVRLNTEAINGSADSSKLPSTLILADIGITRYMYSLSASDFKKETMLLVFSDMVRTQSVNLTIMEDDVLETNETFMAVLELVDDDRIILQPNAAFITIVDDDSKHNIRITLYNYTIIILSILAVVIGFADENHTVVEGVSMFTDITVSVLNGELGTEVVITVNTQAGTAKGIYRQ